jgi:Lon protease-like protein
MPRFLPVFPLSLVAYPGEKLNLHIFEPRYKALVQDVMASDGLFGLPPFLDEQVYDHGTVMRIAAVEKTYEDGKLDIRTEGIGVYRTLDFLREVPDKPYAAAIVDDLEDRQDQQTKESSALFGYWRQFQDLLHLDKPRYELPSEMRAFAIAHLVGLSMKQECELLRYESESDRQKYLVSHLKEVIPVIRQTERVRERARLNGHFRHEIPPAF